MMRTLALGLFFVLLRLPALAQSPLSLPFFDDFARYNNQLDPTKWEPGGGAYLNDHFSETPISKNIVTFNGYSSDGELSFTLSPANIDSLTSRPINLGGLAASDSVYLSFYLQTGGLGSIPQSNPIATAFFQILFKDNTGTWQEARRINPPNSGNFRPNFQQYIIRITDASFLHNNFQFMFRGFGRNRFSQDTWNLDYVQLGANRRVNEQLQDVAASRRVQPVLQRYSAMPIHQFNANIAGEINDSIYTTLNNLENNFRNIPNFTSIQVGNNSPVVSMPQTIAIPPLAKQFRTSTYAPMPGTFSGLTGFQNIKATVFITSSEAGTETLYNDTISRVTA
ncbi:MAG TPA: hypothetical protein VK927_04825, partial [Adhaeribacter sp.]|nr:hypothetical protein [Adhaeribacter sp.]